MKKIIYVFLLLVACNTNNSNNKQTDKVQDELVLQADNTNTFPEIGKPMPDFMLKNIQYYDKQEASLKDFRGKWLILDFWNRLCKTCIASFPKVNKLRKEFRGKVEFVLVGRNDGKYYSGAKKLYERVRDKHNLDLPLVYDANLVEKFGVTSVPHIIWIDDKGIVRAVTMGADLNAENLEAFLSGETPKVFHKPNAYEEQEMRRNYNYKKPLLIDGNGGKGDNFLYRSLLTGKNEYVFNAASPSCFIPFRKKNEYGSKFSVVNSGIQYLYKLAYGDTIRPNPDILSWKSGYGKWLRMPILEVTDSSDFKRDYITGKGIYSYELIVPEDRNKNTLFRQKIMQRDLQNYFNYDVNVETRLMPYWRVITTKNTNKKLITKGEETAIRGDSYQNIELINIPMEKLISIMWGYHQIEPPFIDETGIKQNIDITLKGNLTKFKEFRQALKENGIELVKSKKEMKVIVIRDPVIN
ncbi:MAG: TlpA family protein disulfide reductase [Flavobacteriaceae bacterium]|nr:TlpA family protein disulfide reductase [Flavobacteriaceae bacterium]